MKAQEDTEMVVVYVKGRQQVEVAEAVAVRDSRLLRPPARDNELWCLDQRRRVVARFRTPEVLAYRIT